MEMLEKKTIIIEMKNVFETLISRFDTDITVSKLGS